MFEQITEGIKVVVKTAYNGCIEKGITDYHSFSYFITIKNISEDTVQLLERYWEIYDSLNITEIVQGDGVVGQTPILAPNEEYNYTSNCFLSSEIGSMGGHYTMANLITQELFLVTIPSFQLTTTPILN